MTQPKRAQVGRSHRGVPIAVQVGVLLMISLLAAQAMSVLMVVISPPPPVPVYELTEVAAALKGGSLDSRFGRRMVRSTEASPPAEPDRPGFRAEVSRRMLSFLLEVPQDRLRFIWTGRRAGDRLMRRFRPPEGFRRPPGPPAALAGLRSPEVMGLAGGAVMGGFVAAVQQAGGSWTVVRSPPEALFSAWHRRMALWLLSCLAIVAPAAYLFARRITAPIDRFARAAQALGRDPRAPPMALTGPAEIGAAATAFNEMQARIRRYVEDRTAMVGAISHDLRTPLARIRYKLEAAPDDLKALVLSDVERMEQMIGSVLAFIREASDPRKRERLDLLSVIECVADEASLAGADVEILQASPMEVEGDMLALQRMFTNLLDNAVKYGVRARILASEAAGEAVIEIRDDGRGLPQGELDRVFEPFYRSNSARTLDNGGVGLGLSVARSIARAHGGEVDLALAPEGGLIARVRLPLADGR